MMYSALPGSRAWKLERCRFFNQIYFPYQSHVTLIAPPSDGRKKSLQAFYKKHTSAELQYEYQS